jgi:wyosine [tRNA(Phe)-imidazoG37] synthetase (radical SAM superfamily)
MSWTTFRAVVAEIQNESAEVTFAQWGEPTLHEQLPEMVRYCDKNSLYTTLITNASRLTPTLSESLIDAGLKRIVFSVDTSEESQYNHIRVKGCFRDALSNVLTFLKTVIDKRADAWSSVCMIDSGDSEARRRFHEFYSRFPVTQILVSPFLNIQGRIRERNIPEEETATSFEPARAACSSPWFKMAIHYDGRVPACASDFDCAFCLGDVNKSSIREIWAGEMACRLRRAHLSGSLGIALRSLQSCS